MAGTGSASSSDLFTLYTFNMYGKNQGLPLLSYLCSDLTPDIIFLQEHWQTPANLPLILNFSHNYMGYGISAMEHAVQKSGLKGRPFGGSLLQLWCMLNGVRL